MSGPNKIKVACLQLEALDLSQARQALERTLALIDQAVAETQADLIVTPECTYPAYVLGSPKEFKANYPGDPLPQLQAKAKQHSCHLVIGLATPAEGSDGPVLYNEAVLIGPDGEIIGRTAKSLMWHFDSQWFCAGSSYPVFETALGRIGLMICADGRMPEIARSLTLAGAQIILDPTCWVTYGQDRAKLTNPQADFMLATRAFENGVWCAACDKVGLERSSVLYAGLSCIINPQGEKIRVGSSDTEEIVVAEVELKPRAIPAAPRRPELYADLTRPTEDLPIHAILQEPLVPHTAHLRAAVVQTLPFGSTEAMGETVRPLMAQLAKESTDLVVLPDVPPGYTDEAAHQGERVFPFYRNLSKLSGVAILATAIETEGARRYKTAKLFQAGEELGSWRQSHFTPQDEGAWTPADAIGPVVQLPGSSGARIGVMLGADGYGPETARLLMLHGADIILWPTRPTLPETSLDLVQVARTRAAENRVYVLTATPLERLSDATSDHWYGRALIIDPTGIVLAPTLPDTPMTVSSQIFVPLSRDKVRAPNTDTVYSRRPESYGQVSGIR